MQGEGLLKGDFLRFFLGQTAIDEVLVNERVDSALYRYSLQLYCMYSTGTVPSKRISWEQLIELHCWIKFVWVALRGATCGRKESCSQRAQRGATPRGHFHKKIPFFH